VCVLSQKKVLVPFFPFLPIFVYGFLTLLLLNPFLWRPLIFYTPCLVRLSLIFSLNWEGDAWLFGPMCLLFLNQCREWFHCLRSFSFLFLFFYFLNGTNYTASFRTLWSIFLAGEDQQQTNQPNDQPVAGG